MRDLIGTILLATIVLIGLFYPSMEHDVTITLPITENRPFAGVVNGQFVGTDISCKYWLNKSNQDSVTTWTLSYSPMGWLVGEVDAVEKK
jgi:hypothetical protein